MLIINRIADFYIAMTEWRHRIRAALSADRQCRARNRDCGNRRGIAVGESNVGRDLLPSMGAEDFACFLEGKPGVPISGLATAAPSAEECCTTCITISTTPYCHWVRAIGLGSPNRCWRRNAAVG